MFPKYEFRHSNLSYYYLPSVLWFCNSISEYIADDGAWVMAHAFIIATYKMRLCTFDETFFLFHCGFSVFVWCTALTKKRKHCILLMVCVRNIQKSSHEHIITSTGVAMWHFCANSFKNISCFNYSSWIIILDNISDIIPHKS